MSDVIHGRDVVGMFKIDGEWFNIFCATGCEFRLENELIGKTDVNAGSFRKYRVRLGDCSMTFTGVSKTSNANDVLSPFFFAQESVRRTEGEYRILFVDQDGNDKVIAMNGVVRALSIASDINNFSTSTMEIQGTGGFTVPLSPDPPTGCDEWFWDWWETTPGETSISGTGHYGRSFAGHDLIEVDREGIQHDVVDSGTPGNREALYNGGSSIDFDPLNPFNAGERVFVIWEESGS